MIPIRLHWQPSLHPWKARDHGPMLIIWRGHRRGSTISQFDLDPSLMPQPTFTGHWHQRGNFPRNRAPTPVVGIAITMTGVDAA
jgi:hypothetical protein